MQGIKFGTDGIRGVVNKTLTPRVAYDLGCSLALFLLQTENKPKVIIGRDTRKSCSMLESGLCLGLTASGVDCVLVGEMPTPALAYLTKKTKSTAGVMVTASHNLYEYNGFKIFDSKGMKYDILNTLTLERYSQILNRFEVKESHNMGVCKVDYQLIEKYVSYLKKFVNTYKLKICFDCANGVTYKIIKKLFPNSKIIGTELYNNKENLNCGATCISNLKNFIVKSNYDVGFSFDGDGDRLITVLKDGTVLDGDDILFLLSKNLKSKGKLNKNEVVGTIMTNYGIELALNNIGIKLIRQSVGDKFICAEMRKKKLSIGAEQSGHIIVNRDCLIGDGIYAAIQVLNLINEIGDLKDYMKEVKKFNQIHTSLVIAEDLKDYVLNNCEFKSFLENCENELGFKGRLFVRKSGTENLIRILVEGENIVQLEGISKTIKEKIIELCKIT